MEKLEPVPGGGLGLRRNDDVGAALNTARFADTMYEGREEALRQPERLVPNR